MNRTTVSDLHVTFTEKQTPHISGSRAVAAILVALVSVGLPESKVTDFSPMFR
jgi:hypothetical protein